MTQKTKKVFPQGTKIPHHIALILDGNRRWARSRGLSTFEGHMAGFEAGKKLARAAREFGIHTFTVWGFSTENWDRSPQEINYLMKLFVRLVEDVRKEAKKEGVRFVHLGRKDRLPKNLVKMIIETEEETKKNKNYVFNVALDYGGRDEIIRGIKKLVEKGIPAEKINDKVFSSFLDTGNQPYPDPDLFIRPSGEQRTSGLLPWQMVYSEYYWECCHLPDLTPNKLKEIILDYSRRRRRFGGNDTVEHFDFNPQVVAKLELDWWRLAKLPKGTSLSEAALDHLRKLYGISKEPAKKAAYYLLEAFHEKDNGKNWIKAKKNMKSFYKIIKNEVKLAFEPEIVANLQVKFWKDIDEKNKSSVDTQIMEETAKELCAEVYRISLLQAAKSAKWYVQANVERVLAENGFGEEHWDKAEEYLIRFYDSLKERVA